MRKYTLCPLAALALGCGGAALRMWQESRYADGFPPVGDLSSLLLIALCVLAAAGAALLAQRSRKLRPGALFSGPSRINGGLLILSALALLGSAVFHLVHIIRITGIGPDSQVSPMVILFTAPLELLQVILAVPAVVCLIFLAKDALIGEGRSLVSLTVLLPPACGWLFLIDLYRRSVSDPIVWDYAFLLFAIITLLVAACCRSAFALGVGKPRTALFVTLLSLPFTVTALTDCDGIHALLVLVAFLIYTLAELPVFGPYIDPPAQPDEIHSETQEETTHE